MSKKVKTKMIPHQDFQSLMGRLATSFLADVPLNSDPTKINLFAEKQKAKADLCMALGQNVPFKEIEINEGEL